MSGDFPREITNGIVTLRQWRAEDFNFYAAYLADESTARFYGGRVDKQKAWRHLASLIGHWTLRNFGVYAVASSTGGELQGCVGLWQPYDWPCREFVFWFTADAYASGRALAAARLGLGLVRAASLPAETVTTFIHPGNDRALSLAHTLGGISRGEEPLFDFGPHVRVEYADRSS
jgi:RimJ/RimL family protein N-acetyltransferase